MANSVEDKYSRYTQGGTTTAYKKKNGWWERRDFETASTDIIVTITPKYVGRPDLLAADYYENPRLMWMILQYNGILDINTEFVLGKQLTLPSRQRAMFDIINQPIGGVQA